MITEELLSNVTFTENGDIAFKDPSQDPFINILFSTEYYQKHPIEVPSIGTSERSKLFAMFIRDPRFGLGRRDLGRYLLHKSGCNINEIVKCGRVDDIFYCQDMYSDVTWDNICEYLYNEIQNGNELVKKWMPRFSSKNKDLAIKFANEWFSSVKGGETYVGRKCLYNKFIKAQTTEQHLSRKETEKIRFECVPSLASLKYAHRFSTGEDTKERYKQYLSDVKSGKKKLNVATSTCYDIYRNRQMVEPDIFFDQLPKISGSWLPIIDTSGSMYDANDSYGKAVSIGHYLAKCSTFLPNVVLPFSSRPYFIKLGEPHSHRMFDLHKPIENESSQYNKEIDSIYTGDCSNTNFSKVMELLSEVTVYPEYLIVLSDMQFDQCSGKNTLALERKWRENNIPTKIIWWNFNSRESNCAPETDEMGNIFLSGYNPQLLKFLESGFDAIAFLNKLLDEYKKAIA